MLFVFSTLLFSIAGFLYRGVKDRYWPYRMMSFFTSFLLALQQALAPSIALKTFLSGALFRFCVLLADVVFQ